MLHSKPILGSLVLLGLVLSVVSLVSITPVFSQSVKATFYYSNLNEGAKIVGDSNSVTVSLTQPLITQFNSTIHQNEYWAYQYNFFWSNSSSSGKYPFMSQTTVGTLFSPFPSSECLIATGYGPSKEQIKHFIDCSELTQAGDSWQIVIGC